MLIDGRYVFSLEDRSSIYSIKYYRPDNNEIVMRRIFDQNGILLDDKLE